MMVPICGSTIGTQSTTMAYMDGEEEGRGDFFTLHGAGSDSNSSNMAVGLACSSGTVVQTPGNTGKLFVQVACGVVDDIESFTGMVYSGRMPSTLVKGVTYRTCTTVHHPILAGNRLCITETQDAHGRDGGEVIILQGDGQVFCGSIAEAIIGWTFILMMEAGCGSITGIPLTTTAAMDGEAVQQDRIYTRHGAGSVLSISSVVVLLVCSSGTGALTLETDGKCSVQEV
jgi:hypothetical protein